MPAMFYKIIIIYPILQATDEAITSDLAFFKLNLVTGNLNS